MRLLLLICLGNGGDDRGAIGVQQGSDSAAVAAGCVNIVHTGLLIHQNLHRRRGKAALGVGNDKTFILFVSHNGPRYFCR